MPSRKQDLSGAKAFAFVRAVAFASIFLLSFSGSVYAQGAQNADPANLFALYPGADVTLTKSGKEGERLAYRVFAPMAVITAFYLKKEKAAGFFVTYDSGSLNPLFRNFNFTRKRDGLTLSVMISDKGQFRDVGLYYFAP